MNDPPQCSGPVISPCDWADLQALDDKINALLPPQYQNCYDAVKPGSMGTAGLVYGPDGKVAWDQIWTSFCDLALAGGPPHRGKLLEPARAEETFSAREAYEAVVAEISRGVWLVTQLPVLPHQEPGWVSVRCQSALMASWLARAIMVENVWARCRQDFLYLPASPHYQLDKEIKNVVTAVAKTYHYWAFHMPASRWTNGPTESSEASEFLEPALPWEASADPQAHGRALNKLAGAISEAIGLPTVESAHAGWLGIQCADAAMAIWLMRALVVENVMVRTEDGVLYLPASPAYLEGGKLLTIGVIVARAWRLWEISSRLRPGGAKK